MRIKKLYTVFFSIFIAVALVGCNIPGFSSKINTDDIEKEMKALSEKYSSVWNSIEDKNESVRVQIIEGKGSLNQITYTHNKKDNKSIYMDLTIQVPKEGFGLDKYPRYKEALEIFHGKDSDDIKLIEDGIKKALLEIKDTEENKFAVLKGEKDKKEPQDFIGLNLKKGSDKGQYSIFLLTTKKL